jgi:hypothetical protein
MMSDPLADAARDLGRQHGSCLAANIAKKFDIDTARIFLIGYPKKDPLVMDLYRNPMDVYFQGEPAPMFILTELLDKAGSAGSGDDDVLQLYEDAYEEGFWDKLVTISKEMLSGRI